MQGLLVSGKPKLGFHEIHIGFQIEIASPRHSPKFSLPYFLPLYNKYSTRPGSARRDSTRRASGKTVLKQVPSLLPGSLSCRDPSSSRLCCLIRWSWKDPSLLFDQEHLSGDLANWVGVWGWRSSASCSTRIHRFFNSRRSANLNLACFAHNPDNSFKAMHHRNRNANSLDNTTSITTGRRGGS